MEYEWDPAKARANLRKHAIVFADAVGAIEDPWAITIEDPHPTEERVLNLGEDFLGRIIVVNWTARGDTVRLISARLATRAERRRYEEGLDHA